MSDETKRAIAMKYINILFPVYNERLRLENGIVKTVNFMDKLLPERYELTIIDNASTDETPMIANEMCKKYSQAHYIRLEEKGVGIAFRAGIMQNEEPIVGYMDIDLSTDITHLEDVIHIFQTDEKIDMINGSRWNKYSDTKGRKWYRNITSLGLTILLKLTLGMKATDSICGFKFYRKEIAEELVKDAGSDENGWFYLIELLLNAERNGMEIYEMPVRWRDDYNSTVNVVQQIRNYCVGICHLKKKYKLEKRK